MVKEFTDFPDVGAIQAGDKVVGTRDNVNIQFDFDSGIKDSSGHYIFAYESVSNLIKNYLKFINADSGSPAQITTDGVDANISMLLTAKGEGNFTTSTTGLGNINFNTQSGKFYINSTTGINAVLDENNMASDSATAVPTQKSTKAYVDAATDLLSSLTFVTNTDESSILPNSVRLLGTANQITATNGTLSLPSTLIAPGTFRATTSINIAGAGATITSFSTDGTLAGNSDALSSTQKAVKTYVDTADTAIKSYSYITKTDNTANLPGSTPLSGLASGFLSNTTATGNLNPRTHTGTANQIDITNGSGVSGNPTYQLSSTLVAPGTFTIGSGYVVNNISNSPTSVLDTDLMTAYATQMAISSAIDSGVSFRGGWDASGGLYPSTGGTGIAGVIEKGNWWYITVAGTLSGTVVQVGDWITALIDVPGQTGSNWLILREGVNSVFGRNGAVVAMTGDYTIAQITNGLSNALTANYFFVGNGGNIATGVTSQSALNTLAGGVTSGQYLRGNGSNILLSAIQAADVPTLNQNTTGQAGSVANAATFNNGGAGAASGATYDGSAARTISYNTIGASPLAGSSSITTVGTITSGTWQGTAIDGAHGGTGQTTTTGGDLLVGASSNTWSKLATDLSCALTTSEFGALRWTNLGLGQVLMGSFTSGAVAGTISAGTGLGSSFGVGNITLALSVPVVGANGGTGQTTTTAGDLLIGAASNTWNKLAGVATGNALLSGGVGVAPAWGKVDLTAAITGILPAANGGTGNSSAQAASVANALTMNNSGSGDASGATFNGSATKTISYNTIGASPLAGSSSLVTVGTITSGTWQGTAVAAGFGGTGQTTYAIGDLLQASSTSALSKLAAVATGNVLLSGGVGAVSSWGKVSLTVAVSGILPVANGGTGNSSGQAASVANAATFNNGGAGAASGTTFDGSVARTISYNTVGASPLAGSSSLTTTGTITSGTWNGTAVAAGFGGTGQSSYAVGDILYASTTSALSKLADVATGNVLLSGGVGVAPSWGKVSLTGAVSGTLPIANGGTGNTTGQAASVVNAATFNNSGAGVVSGTTFDGSATRTISYNTIGASPLAGSSSIVTVGTLTSGTWNGTAITAPFGGTGQSTYVIGDLLQASSTSALSKLAAVATGNVLLSGGVGATSTWGKVDLTAAVSGILPTANGGTGNSSGQAASVANALTLNNAGTGAASGSTYNGSGAITLSYNTLGASPLAGSSSLTTTGTITSGTWNGSVLGTTYGGTGLSSVTNSSVLSTNSSGAVSWLNIGLGQVLMGSLTGPVAGTVSASTGLVGSGGPSSITISLDVPVVGANGGTGQTTTTAGDLLVGAASNTWNKLAAVATGNVLLSGGVGAAPSWGKVDLTAAVTGVLPVANGGTGFTSPMPSGYIYMNTGNWTGATLAYTTSYQELTGLSTAFTLASPANNFSMTTDGRLKYTGSANVTVVVEAYLSVNNAGSFAIQIYKNGVAVSGSESYSVGAQSVGIPGFYVTMSTNDYISLWTKRSVGSVSPAITQISLSARGVA